MLQDGTYVVLETSFSYHVPQPKRHYRLPSGGYMVDGHWKSVKPPKPKPKLDQYGLPPRQTTVHITRISDNVYRLRPDVQRSSIWTQLHAARIRSLHLSSEFVATIVSINEKESGKLCLKLQIRPDGCGVHPCLVGNALKLVTIEDSQERDEDKQDKQRNEKKRSVEAISDNNEPKKRRVEETAADELKPAVKEAKDYQAELEETTEEIVENLVVIESDCNEWACLHGSVDGEMLEVVVKEKNLHSDGTISLTLWFCGAYMCGNGRVERVKMSDNRWCVVETEYATRTTNTHCISVPTGGYLVDGHWRSHQPPPAKPKLHMAGLPPVGSVFDCHIE